jgi:hypothetical protein
MPKKNLLIAEELSLSVFCMLESAQWCCEQTLSDLFRMSFLMLWPFYVKLSLGLLKLYGHLQLY